MAKMIPKTISLHTKSRAEKDFFALLQNDPDTKDWIVLHSVQIAKHNIKIQGEIDFIVIIPKRGIFAVEVKGGRIHYQDGIWTTTNIHGECNRIYPVEEAINAMFSLRDYVNVHLPFEYNDLKNCLWGFCLVFPDCHFGGESVLPDLATEQIADAKDMGNISNYFTKLANFWKDRATTSRLTPLLPNATQCNVISNILKPTINFNISIKNQIETVENQIISLTDNQNTIFEGLVENERCLIRGGAGTGKTLLALNFYKEVFEKGGNVAFFCYNTQLAAYLQQSVRSPYSCCFHEYMETIARSVFPAEVEHAKSNLKQYYESDLPDLFMDAFIQNDCETFDYLILDEAQDLMSPKYLQVFDLIVSGGLKRGKWLLFMDADNQNLYSSYSYQDVKNMLADYDAYYTKYALKDNCRNSVAIIEQVDKWFGFTTQHRNVQEKGVDVKIEPYRAEEDAPNILEKMLLSLLGQFSPADIVVLSPKRLKNSIASKIQSIPISETRKKGEVYFSTIQSFKGLESKIVVLCDISDLEDAQNKQYLYVGMTRAKSALYIIIQKRGQRILDTKE